MNSALLEKLKSIKQRYIAIEDSLSEFDDSVDIEKLKNLSKEKSKLNPIIDTFDSYLKVQQNYFELKEYLDSDDIDLKQLALEEIEPTKADLAGIELDLKKLLVPKDDSDSSKSLFLEIRAGTGGDESAIFVGDLFKMYSYYCELNRFKIEVINSYPSEQGGFKEIIIQITGSGAYRNLKYESGTHRVQRVPDTESQGRVHTSVVTVAVLPVVDSIESVNIDMADIRVDTFRASGAGGQHVNKTDSAIRLTHQPTGVVVECQEGRSQHKNKEKALSILATKILDMQRSQQKLEIDKERKSQVGSGERSERIRTYNYPQNRVTDHRIKLTLYKLEEVLQGSLDMIIKPLILDDETKKLAAVEQQFS